MLIGSVGTAYGLPAWAALGLSILALYLILKFWGVRISEEV